MSIYTVAITGASGAPYAMRLLQVLLQGGHRIYLCITGDGRKIVNDEVGILLKGSESDIERAIEQQFTVPSGQLRYFDEENMYTPIASGSSPVDAMVVVPCSMKALGAIANGFASNLIERAADVMIKEKRKLILVPREMPLSPIHLRNMLTLAEAGCHIVPAMPGFYHRPKHLQDIVDFVVGRVLDAMGVENTIAARWGL
jgi:4-hydroxy-3-polyprenylbenzoate decarboxylase